MRRPAGALASHQVNELLDTHARLADEVAQETWTQGRVLASDKRRSGWALPVPGGLLGPHDLLDAHGDAHKGTAKLSASGATFELSAGSSWASGGLARRDLELEGMPRGPAPNLAPWSVAPVDVLVTAGSAAAPRALSAARLRSGESSWRVDSAVAFAEGWNGAAVVDRSSGALLGLLLVQADGARVQSIPPEALGE